MLSPGSVIVFSAGSEKLEPENFRIMRAEAEPNRFYGIAQRLPHLYQFLSPVELPLLINCYPAPIGTFSMGIFTDTYMRWQNVVRALLLAQQKNMTAIVIGQPLAVLHFLLTYQKLGHIFPNHFLIGLGGYYCPPVLEQCINQIANNQKKNQENKKELKISRVFHGYGTAEADFNCLVGVRDELHTIAYYSALEHIEPLIENNKLFLRHKKNQVNHSTGDFAREANNGGIHIENNSERLSPEIKNILDRWTEKDWERRTGYIAPVSGKFIFQLREGFSPVMDNELKFSDFAEQFSFSWLDKPRWGITS